MSAPFIGALDQGTTSTRFIVFDRDRKPVAQHQVEHKQITPHPGWLSHDAEEIAANSKRCIGEAIKQLRERHGVDARVEAMGVTNQRETTVAWDSRTGKPLAHAIVWSDARTEAIVHELSKGNPDGGRAECGLPFSTYFSAGKMTWLLRNEAAVKHALSAETLRFGTVDTWLIWTLTEGRTFVTDCTNASRTMLMNIATLRWSPKQCELFQVPQWALPRIVPSSGDIAVVDNSVFGITDHPPIPITGCIGDQQGALVGQLCFNVGDAKNTYGTGCFLLANIGTQLPPPSRNGLLTTVAYQLGDEKPVYALEGAIAGAGATVQWLRDGLGIISSAADSAKLAGSVPNTGGVVFVPAFGGLLAPYWRPDARGLIIGMTMQTTAAHIVRAVLEAIAQQVCHVVDAMEKDSGVVMHGLSVDGGMVANNVLMRIQADALGRDVIVPQMLETTAVGAAICASLPKKLWGTIHDLESHREARVVKPRDDPKARADNRKRWEAAVPRSFGWSKL
jgi:glycerol kinase